MTLESYLAAGDVKELATFCEEAELIAPHGVSTPEIYGCLLGVYLLQNELDHAKLLWKRIPGSVKLSDTEISDLWEIGKRLWNREFSEVYSLINKRVWPPHIDPLLLKLTENVRQRVLSLVSKAYSNIGLDQMCLLLGAEEENTLSIVREKGWEFDNTTRVVVPKPPEPVVTETQDSQYRLAQLVDIVSFLEN